MAIELEVSKSMADKFIEKLEEDLEGYDTVLETLEENGMGSSTHYERIHCDREELVNRLEKVQEQIDEQTEGLAELFG